MLNIFCRDHHRTSGHLCTDCTRLLDYAHGRLSSCPFSDAKPACNRCTIHCYSSNMRAQVKQVMRYAGPRMVFKHPLLALGHLVDLGRDTPELLKNRRKQHDDQKQQN